MSILNPETKNMHRLNIEGRIFTHRWWLRLNVSDVIGQLMQDIMHSNQVYYSRYDDFQCVWFRDKIDAKAMRSLLGDLYTSVEIQTNEAG
jgi:putative heme degradation protein